MAQTHLKVVGIVRGRDFNRAGTEIYLNVIVRNNGYLTVNERKYKRFTYNILISFIIRIYRNGGIASK